MNNQIYAIHEKLKNDKCLELIIGNKGKCLLEISNLNIPTPRGIIIPIKWEFTNNDLNSLDKSKLYAVRAAASVPMPGVLDTYLNVEYKNIFKKISMLYDSWNLDSIAYRSDFDLLCLEGIAVIIQEMVHGDFDNKSGTGVLDGCKNNKCSA